jgi:antitoxin component of MazEF toxin-antitoxin module
MLYVMRDTVDIPINLLKELNLHDGEKVVGETRGNVVRFSVVEVTDELPSEERIEKGLAFLEKWKGIGKNMLNKDYSDDPRAEYLLNR